MERVEVLLKDLFDYPAGTEITLSKDVAPRDGDLVFIERDGEEVALVMNYKVPITSVRWVATEVRMTLR